jgi:hypothetical protein
MGVARRPTYADASLDRLVHNAHRIELTGESLRRNAANSSKPAVHWNARLGLRVPISESCY